jgi:hypothetical protein
MLGVAARRVPTPQAGTAEVEQGMVVVRDVAHADTDLAVVDLPPVATPLALHPHGVRAALGETAGIEGNDAIGLAQSSGHLANQHLDQRAMIPWRRTDEVLHDLSLDIDQGSDFLGILAIKVGRPTR